MKLVAVIEVWLLIDHPTPSQVDGQGGHQKIQLSHRKGMRPSRSPYAYRSMRGLLILPGFQERCVALPWNSNLLTVVSPDGCPFCIFCFTECASPPTVVLRKDTQNCSFRSR